MASNNLLKDFCCVIFGYRGALMWKMGSEFPQPVANSEEMDRSGAAG